MSQHRDITYPWHPHWPHWNEMLPGDSFRFVGEPGSKASKFCIGRDVWILLNVTYMVVSRRLGPEHPYPRNYYVILGPGTLKEYLL